MILIAFLLAAAAASPSPSPRPSASASPRSYTDEDLKKTRGSTESGIVKGLPPASAAPVAPPSQEEAWRSRAAAARARIDLAEKAVKNAEAALDGLGAIPAPTQAPNGRDPLAEHQEKVATARQAVDAARLELDAAKKGLDELEDEARRKQIPPGWLRER